MGIKRTINGYIITVQKWNNIITVKNTKTNEIKKITCADHIKAVLIAKSL